MTPSRHASRAVAGFHSNRRVPDRRALEGTIVPLYRELAREEAAHRNARDGLQASMARLNQTLADQGRAYDEFIFSL